MSTALPTTERNNPVRLNPFHRSKPKLATAFGVDATMKASLIPQRQTLPAAPGSS